MTCKSYIFKPTFAKVEREIYKINLASEPQKKTTPKIKFNNS